MSISNSRVRDFINKLLSSTLASSISHYEVLPESPAKYRELKINNFTHIKRCIDGLNVNLYSHQTQAIEALLRGENVVISTPTASGKSLVYNSVILTKLSKNPKSTSIYLFPLKALSQDQLRAFYKLLDMVKLSKITAEIYDGDTSAYRRRKIRSNIPNVIFTNPDMLHLSLLPHHRLWQPLWANLSYIVVDELHIYRGIFGSHMSWVFKRLKRIASLYGSKPTFCLCSATIGNPKELATKLIDEPLLEISESGAPQPRRHIVLMNPPDENASKLAILLLKAALSRGLKTIIYTNSRKMTELISLWAQSACPKYKDKISAYRAGFLPQERRKIERELSEGRLLAVISTSALELGIDIGGIDVSILVGYPGTQMACWQRWGRAGRKAQDCALILIACQDALDQYFMRHPRELIPPKVESAVINPFNPSVMRSHLVCAAKEIPINEREDFFKDNAIKRQISALEAKAELLRSADGQFLYASKKAPERDVDIRGTGKKYTIIDSRTGEIIGDIDGIRAFKEAHPGALYLHAGTSYIIEDIDIDRHIILAIAKKVNYFTRYRGRKSTSIIEEIAYKELGNLKVGFGRLKIVDKVIGYEKRSVAGQRLLGIYDLDLPPVVFETQGFWIKVPPWLEEKIIESRLHFMGSIHAIEHAIIATLPLFVLADRNDLGGISTPFHDQIKESAVFVYDGVSGGAGLCEEAFKKIGDILSATLRMISSCPCKNGCPSCVHSPKCGAGNRPIDKEGAITLLRFLISNEKITSLYNKGLSVSLNTNSLNTKDKLKINHNCEVYSKELNKDLTSSLKQLKYGVLDIETQYSAQEVGGWHKAHLMKVSCCVLYSSLVDDFLVFREKDLSNLFNHLKQLDLIVGFNIKKFDYNVLSVYTDYNLYSLSTLDILEDVYSYLGYRLSLDHLASVTLNAKKIANGLIALKWWKEGKIDKIISYCKQDVLLTKKLFLFGVKNNYILFKNKAGTIVRIPVDWYKFIKNKIQ